ncbi:hypothetical protein DFH07DRAFT_800219 [Mycena maculata]|uniref:Uncharacterized protein n=1 Tax=Mycena maculata TaxID=230809 RepID=A0AAD7JYH4_9AGAR|nr:hypothetical protein DFH07DRAFT_800219 [Mycena maculata]
MFQRVAIQRTQLAVSLGRRHASSFRQPFKFRLINNRVQAVVGVSVVSILAIGAAGAMLNTGMHMWLEYHLRRLKADVDSETRAWGWDSEAERWTGDPERGGTDSALGRKGRQAVRNAWFSDKRPEKYGPLDADEGQGAANMVDALLLRTEASLRSAIAYAETPDIVGNLHPSTLVDLLTKRAAVLERLGPSHLGESRAQYERVWSLLGGRGFQAARIAVKLGDISQRLGDGPEALVWWARAISLVNDDRSGSLVPTVPPAPPSPPVAQRILVSALLSLSAFYAMARQLTQARQIEEGSLDLLRSIPPPESLASASPPQALHSLSLLHRSAILSMHLAEVLYAQRVPVAECLQRLQAAATSSERVAYALVGTSVRDSEQLAPSPEDPLLAEYIDNPYLEKPASDLLRDARRSAADTWNLMGDLTERLGPSHRQLAFEYYQRAIGWAGKTNEKGILEPAGSTLRDDWTLIWRNYTRMKQVVQPVPETK